MRRIATRRLALLPLACLACAALWAAHARAITPIDSTPVATLREMASSPVVFEAGDFAIDQVFYARTETFTFSVPPGTVPAEPDSSWFLLDLDYRIVFGEESAKGFAWVSADTNGLTAAQAEYVVTRARGDLTILESTVTLHDGQEERALDGLAAEVDYVNYARDEGIVEGRNTFTVRVEHTEGVVIERIEFLGTSGVSRTAVSPDPLRLTASVTVDEIRVGDEFELSVRAENSSAMALRDVRIEAEPNPGFARIVGTARHDLGWLDETAKRVFRLEALRSGPGQVAVFGTSDRNELATVVDLHVLPRAQRGTRTVVLIALIAAVPVALVAAGLLVRARRRAP